MNTSKSKNYIVIENTTIIIKNINIIEKFDALRFYLYIDGRAFAFDTREDRDNMYNHIIDII